MTLSAPAPSIRPRLPPVPWYVQAAAARAVEVLAPEVGPRTARLRPALARPSAHNRVAVDRLFSAFETALRPDIATLRHSAVRHHALMASALSPLRPRAANDNEPPGIVVQRLLCLAGKRLDWREIGPVVEVSRHALGRFVERSGRSEPPDVHAAVLEAAEAADLMLAVHCEGALGRLAGGVAAVLLPTANGAFLGHLRLLSGRAGQPVPVIEAQTWLHQCDLREAQAEVWGILTSSLPAEEMIRHLPGALQGLRTAARGDRRVIGGLEVLAPGAEPAREFRMALGCSQPVALARIRLGTACADTIAVERKGR
jgi:hypothetical protein